MSTTKYASLGRKVVFVRKTSALVAWCVSMVVANASVKGMKAVLVAQETSVGKDWCVTQVSAASR